MKIYINNTHKRIDLTVEMGDYITRGDAKMVKQWMTDTKSLLESYTNEMIAKAEKDLRIGFTDIYELSATYYSSCEMPVIMIIGRGYDRRPNSDLAAIFIEAFTDGSECGTTENRYSRTA